MTRFNNEGSVIGQTARLVGRVSGSGALRIEGSLQGDVDVSGAVEIPQGGLVEGDLRAESLDLIGTLTGDVETSGPIMVRAGATVRGELKGSEVSIEPGAAVSVVLNTEFDLDLPSQRRSR